MNQRDSPPLGSVLFERMNDKITYPFRNNPPFIQGQEGYTLFEEPNAVGSYRRDFELPADWKDKEIFLHFNGCYSAMYVWVNGQKVGYSQGANNDAIFDITKYAEVGRRNMVAVWRFIAGAMVAIWRIRICSG